MGDCRRPGRAGAEPPMHGRCISMHGRGVATPRDHGFTEQSRSRNALGPPCGDRFRARRRALGGKFPLLLAIAPRPHVKWAVDVLGVDHAIRPAPCRRTSRGEHHRSRLAAPRGQARAERPAGQQDSRAVAGTTDNAHATRRTHKAAAGPSRRARHLASRRVTQAPGAGRPVPGSGTWRAERGLSRGFPDCREPSRQPQQPARSVPSRSPRGPVSTAPRTGNGPGRCPRSHRHSTPRHT